jgi:hypothetical protein
MSQWIVAGYALIAFGSAIVGYCIGRRENATVRLTDPSEFGGNPL